MVCVYPLFHMGAWTISLQQWQARDLVVYRAEAGRAGGLRGRPAVRGRSASTRMPAVWQRVLDTLDAERETGGDGRLPQLRLADSGTSATPRRCWKRSRKPVPMPGSACSTARRRPATSPRSPASTCSRKPGSCGVPSQAPRCGIDPDTGELCVRGPLLFDGYYGDPDATARGAAGRLVPHRRLWRPSTTKDT